MELPKEQYEYQKTLAEIGTKIASGRAVLSELEEKKDLYLKKVELESEERIAAIVKASSDALAEAGKNQDILEAYSNELGVFAVELISWKEKLIKQQQEFEVKSGSAWDSIGRKTKELEKISTTLRMQQAKIISDKEANRKRELSLNEKERSVTDRYNTLLRAEKEKSLITKKS